MQGPSPHRPDETLAARPPVSPYGDAPRGRQRAPPAEKRRDAWRPGDAVAEIRLHPRPPVQARGPSRDPGRMACPVTPRWPVSSPLPPVPRRLRGVGHTFRFLPPLSRASRLLQVPLPAGPQSERGSTDPGARVPPEVITGQAGGRGCSRNGVRAPPGREGHRRGREGRKALSWHFRVCVWRQLGAELLKMCERRGWFKKA